MKKGIVLLGGMALMALSLAACGGTNSSGSPATAGASIVLSDSGSTASGSGARVEGGRVTISQGGEYRISGSLTEGQLYVDAGGDDTVILRLAGVEVTNSTDAALHVENAGLTVLRLEEGSQNLIQSGAAPAEGVLAATPDEEASGGAVYARDDLTIEGTGALRVLGYLNNGVQSSNALTVAGGTVTVEAVNNGVKGKDSVTVTGGTLDILSGGDGIKSDDTTGEGYGTVAISGGSFTIQAGGDAVQAETTLTVTGGDFTVTTGGGSADVTFPQDTGWGVPDANWDMEAETETSTKGLKSGTDMTISGGIFSMDCRDDAFHSNGDITIVSGQLTAATGDDGVHADGKLTVRDGAVTVTRSYEGLEGNQVVIYGGDIQLTSADDGINANGGQNQMGGRGGSGKTTQAMPELIITGGNVTVDAQGDGLDSNGNLDIQGGTIIVNGPTGGGNSALDCGSENGGVCTVSGGTVLALGSGGMVETFGGTSAQCSFLHNFEGSFAAGDQITVTDSSGSVLYQYTAVKSGSSVVFSAPGLTQGESYTLRAGDQTAEITLDQVSTTSGAGGFGFGGGNRPGQGPRGGGGQPGEGMPQPPDGMPEGQPPSPPQRTPGNGPGTEQ